MRTDIEAKVRASFEAQSMMTTLGAELTDLSAGRATITAPILPESRQQHGAAHAGLTFSIGDSAAGYSALTMFPLAAEVVTVEMKINLMAPGIGDRLVAEGRVIKSGRRLTVVQSDVFAERDGTRTQIALLQGTMIAVET
ncbi:MAG: PaaI family thioesterase [Silicimonas sp.]|nr:PaaI family thioesterase [Silicimonas sp.]